MICRDAGGVCVCVGAGTRYLMKDALMQHEHTGSLMEDFDVILLVSRCLKSLVSYEVSHYE